MRKHLVGTDVGANVTKVVEADASQVSAHRSFGCVLYLRSALVFVTSAQMFTLALTVSLLIDIDANHKPIPLSL